MLLNTPIIAMTDEAFRQIRDLVYQFSGLHFNPEAKFQLERRLAKRLQTLQLKSYKDYYLYLRYDKNKDRELAEAINVLTTNETYFFREDFQLKTFTQEILPEIWARKEETGDKQIRIWSAGCSSGEEPYTIAMLMLDQPRFKDWQIEIIGTDISQRVLQIARKGIYGENSFRTTPPSYRRRYFVETEGAYRISDQVRDLVNISYLNLFDFPRVTLLGKMDVIFCRNVIIYFDTAAKRKVVDSFYQRIRPEGFLLLGHSESLVNLTTAFELRHFRHDMVYLRPSLSSALEEKG
jgi:chemotaxis protein methyltransferase CheR